MRKRDNRVEGGIKAARSEQADIATRSLLLGRKNKKLHNELIRGKVELLKKEKGKVLRPPRRKSEPKKGCV